MNSWDKNRKETIYKQKLQKVKSTMHKRTSQASKKKNQIQNQTYSLKLPLIQSEMGTSAIDSANIKIINAQTSDGFPYHNTHFSNNDNLDSQIVSQVVRKENYQKQSNLKKVLKDFGLQQYLRKFYELGYDDSNIHKLAKIPYKEYEEFLVLVKAFPGHKVKIISFIDYIKKLYSAPSNMNSKNNKENYTNNNKFNFNLTNSNNLIKTSQSAATRRVNQLNSNRMNNTNSSKIPKKPKSVETLRTKNKIIKSLAKTTAKNYGFGFDYYLSDNETNKNERKDSNDENAFEAKFLKDDQINNINNQIDKMLNFYMSKLNENMEDSYNSVEDEDSCISNHKLLNFNEYIADDLNYATGEDMDKRLNISVIKIRDEKENSPTSNMNKEVNNEDNFKNEGNLNSTPEKEIVESKFTSDIENKSKKDDLDVNYSNLLEEEINHIETLIDDKLEKSQNSSKTEQRKTNQTQEIKYNISESNIESKSNNDNLNNSSIKNDKTHKTNSPRNNIDPKNNSKPDMDPYSHIRLTKSYEKEYLRQDIDQFDIEYMCRCLGLAVMKHIESGQDKLHIMELIDFTENFSFFNSIFNSHMDFFFTFFNMENQDKISNLDKLDLNDYKKSSKLPDPVKSDNKETASKPISFFSHVEANSTKQNSDIKSEKNIFNSNLDKIPKDSSEILINDRSTLDQDFKFITEFFKPQPKSVVNYILNDRYKNLNDKTKKLLTQDLNSIQELDSVDYCIKNMLLTVEHKKESEGKKTKFVEVDYVNLLKRSAAEFVGLKEKNENYTEKKDEVEAYPKSQVKENKFSNYQEDYTNTLPDNLDKEDIDEYFYTETPLLKIQEEILEKEEREEFESGLIESNYILDITNAEKLKNFLLKTVEIYDDDYNYAQSKIMHKRYAPMPDPNQIFEFCANVIINTKMEKEVIIISLIYIERLIFNTGILINSRNWRRLLFTSLIIASKIWDDDSFENNHFAQVFTHLSIGEINLLERSFLELINYKVYVKCSEYFKYFFIIKSIALKYNFDGINLVPISVEKMMVLQEYAFQMQKKLRRKYSYSNSAQF